VASYSATDPASQPGAALHEEIGRLKEFIGLLEREQDLLKKGDTESLLPLIETKTALANSLAALAQARLGQLKRLGLDTGRAGMEAWLAHNDQDGKLREAWQTLLDLAAQARELNITNGKLIGLHMQHNQQAFTALMSATNRAMTYGPDGQQQAGLGGRILGTA
jgi:flagella synthesis protein FlgN